MSRMVCRSPLLNRDCHGRLLILQILLLLTIVFFVPSKAKGGADVNVEGGYVAFGVSFEGLIGTNFDGETFYYYITGAQMRTAIMPDVQNGTAIRVALGYRWSRIAWELIFASSSRSSEWADLSYDVSMKVYGTNVVFFLGNNRLFQPYLLAGGYYHAMSIKDGSARFDWDLLTDDWRYLGIGDARYDGIGANLGIGMQAEVTSLFSIRTEIIYRPASYSQIKFIGQQAGTNFDEKESASGWYVGTYGVFSF